MHDTNVFLWRRLYFIVDDSVTYQECAVDAALNKLKRRIPYGWDLNIYRGCEHGCRYCYAQQSRIHGSADAFFHEIFVKQSIAERLDEALSAPDWCGSVINIGGVTDSYQPAEKHYALMRDVLRVMIAHKNPIIISTKSDLILRDIDLLAELAEHTYVNIAVTVTTLDEAVRKTLEPASAPAERRFAVLDAFAETAASTGLHIMPIVPLLTDSDSGLDALFSRAHDAAVDYALTGALYLRGAVRANFFTFIETAYPGHAAAFRALYQKGGADPAYKTALYARVNAFRKRYDISSRYMKPFHEKMKKMNRL